MNKDLFKVIVRVDLVPEGRTSPLIAEGGLPPIAQFELEALNRPGGLDFLGMEVYHGEHPAIVDRIVTYVLEQLPSAYDAVCRRDMGVIRHAEKRDYTSDGSYNVTKVIGGKFDS